MYTSDYRSVGGLNMDAKGWEGEDLYARHVKSHLNVRNKMLSTNSKSYEYGHMQLPGPKCCNVDCYTGILTSIAKKSQDAFNSAKMYTLFLHIKYRFAYPFTNG